MAKDVHERALGTKLKRKACKGVQCKQVGRIWFWQVREGRRDRSEGCRGDSEGICQVVAELVREEQWVEEALVTSRQEKAEGLIRSSML